MYLRWFDVSAFVTHFHQKPKPDVVAGQQKVLELEVDTLRNVAGVSARIKIGYKINPKTPLRHPTKIMIMHKISAIMEYVSLEHFRTRPLVLPVLKKHVLYSFDN